MVICYLIHASSNQFDTTKNVKYDEDLIQDVIQDQQQTADLKTKTKTTVAKTKTAALEIQTQRQQHWLQ